MNILFLYSLFDEDNPLPDLGQVSPVMRDRLILFGAIFVVVVLVTTGMLLRRVRKRRRAKPHGHSRRRRSFHGGAAAVADLKKMISKKPRHRRAHRSRNPTLAETGGLPPVRSAEPLDPPQSQTQLQ
jgi:hypothetical protein